MAIPQNTTLSLAAAGAASLTAAGELMKSYAASTAVDAEHRIRAAQDSAGDPMIFSIGNQNTFYVIARQPASPTGWEQIDLSSALGAGLQAVAFEVAQDASTGRLTLALAVEDAAQPGASRLYVTAQLRNDRSAVDWHNFGAQWAERPTSAFPGRSISRILLGSNDDRAGPPLMIVAATHGGGDAQHYVVDTNTAHADPAALWQILPLPENTDAFIDLAIGSSRLGRGVYALYQAGPFLHLAFTTFRDKFGHGPYNIALTPPAGARALFPLPNATGFTDLYIAGDSGLHLFTAGAHRSGATAAPVALADTIPAASGLRDLIVCADQATVSIWALKGDGQLVYTTGARGPQPRWSYPIAIRGQVAQIAPLRNKARMANEIFVVGADNRLAHLWQDPVTTLWEEADIPLPDAGGLLAFSCYTTHINLADENGAPLAGQLFNLTASEWTYATVNGVFCALDPARPVAVAPDIQGNITIINKVRTIATPTFHLRADGADQVVDISPAAKVKASLQQFQTGADLRNARTSQGQPIVPAGVDDATLDSSAKAIQQLVGLTGSLGQSGTLGDGAGEFAFATLRSAGSASSAVLSAERAAADYCWGMSFGGGGLLYLEGVQARDQLLTLGGAPAAVLSPGLGDFANAISAIGGDILKALESGVEQVGAFLINATEQGLQFLVNLGNQIYSFALTVESEVLRVVNWVLEQLKIGWDALLDLLGFLFDWGDILATHKALLDMANGLIAYGAAQVGGLEPRVNALFDQAESWIKQMEPLPSEIGGRSSKSAAKQSQAGGPDEIAKLIGSLTSNPGGNWGMYQLLHGDLLRDIDFGIPDWSEELIGAIMRFFEETVLAEVDAMTTTITQLSSDVQAAFQSDNLSINQVFAQIGGDVLLGMLEATRRLLVGLIRLGHDLLVAMQAMFNAEVKIPLLTALYEQHIAPGSKLTLLDAMALLLAIPTTLGYKLVAGRAPFAAGAATGLPAPAALSAQPAATLGEGSGEQGGESQMSAPWPFADLSPDGLITTSHVFGLWYAFSFLLHGILEIAEEQASSPGVKFDFTTDPTTVTQIVRSPNVLKALPWLKWTFSLLTVPSLYPLDKNSAAYIPQWVVFGSYTAGMVQDFVFALLHMKSEGEQLKKAEAVLSAIFSGAVLVAEGAAFGLEYQHIQHVKEQAEQGENAAERTKAEHEQIDIWLKLVQYLLLAVGEIGGAVAAFTEGTPKAVALGVDIGGCALSFLTCCSRAGYNIHYNLSHETA